jgi:hypothetical protein
LRPWRPYPATLRYFGETPLGCERDKSRNLAVPNISSSALTSPDFFPHPPSLFVSLRK